MLACPFMTCVLNIKTGHSVSIEVIKIASKENKDFEWKIQEAVTIHHAKTLLPLLVNLVVPSVMSCSEYDMTVGQGSQSEFENGIWHHAQTSERKNKCYFFIIQPWNAVSKEILHTIFTRLQARVFIYLESICDPVCKLGRPLLFQTCHKWQINWLALTLR